MILSLTSGLLFRMYVIFLDWPQQPKHHAGKSRGETPAARRTVGRSRSPKLNNHAWAVFACPRTPPSSFRFSSSGSKSTTSLKRNLEFLAINHLLRPLHQHPRPGTTNPSSTITDSRRSGWRICVSSTSSEYSPSLLFSPSRTQENRYDVVVIRAGCEYCHQRRDSSSSHRNLWRVIEDGTADEGEACAGILEPDQQKIPCIELGILYRVPAASPLRRVPVGII